VRVDKVHSAAESAVQSLKEYWSSLGKEYNTLKEYCGGIARVMPAKAWWNPISLTDCVLVSILHCK
jgi:hypothetical protein